MRRSALALVVLAGCSFSVDPVTVTPDAAVPDMASSEMDGSVEDLEAPPDLTSNNRDITAAPDLKGAPDLSKPDLLCAPPLFPGFHNGAVSPFDCRSCGCTIDDFTSLSTDRWTSNVPAEWTVALSAGVATFSSSNAGSDNAQLSSDGHFYLDGDFDMLVDYQIVTWTTGGGTNLASLGPGSSAPTIQAHVYLSGGQGYYLRVDDMISQPPVVASDHGTFEILRTGSTICAQIVSGPMDCRSASETNRLTVALDTNVNSGGCSTSCTPGNCCVQKSEFRNLRLKSGVIVSTP